MPQSLKISFVLPIYNESKNIPKLFSELEKVTDKLKTQSKSVELIFVDDGSSDDSFLELQKIYNENPKEIKISILMNRNRSRIFIIQNS